MITERILTKMNRRRVTVLDGLILLTLARSSGQTQAEIAKEIGSTSPDLNRLLRLKWIRREKHRHRKHHPYAHSLTADGMAILKVILDAEVETPPTVSTSPSPDLPGFADDMREALAKDPENPFLQGHVEALTKEVAV